MSTNIGTGAEGGAGNEPARELLIDGQLPRFDARSFSALIVDADTEQTYHAIRALDPEQVAASVPFMRLMGQARALPARLAARHRDGGTPPPQTLPADEAGEAFLPLDEQPGWSSSSA